MPNVHNSKNKHSGRVLCIACNTFISRLTTVLLNWIDLTCNYQKIVQPHEKRKKKKKKNKWWRLFWWVIWFCIILRKFLLKVWVTWFLIKIKHFLFQFCICEPNFRQIFSVDWWYVIASWTGSNFASEIWWSCDIWWLLESDVLFESEWRFDGCTIFGFGCYKWTVWVMYLKKDSYWKFPSYETNWKLKPAPDIKC